MADENRKLDKYEEIFAAVLSKEKIECEEKPLATTEVEVKKEVKNSTKRNPKTKYRAKKQKKTAKERLLELNNFYSKNFGIWIQCTKCHKWRKVMEYQEDHQVPKVWCCSMSKTGTKDCDEPEHTDPNFCSMKFVPGAIVWAKFGGYPWWPGMIEVDPDTEEYYWIDKNGTVDYNVTFLDAKVTHAWVSTSFIRDFLDPPQRNHTPRNDKYSQLIAAAEARAKRAMDMSIKERFQTFSFAHLYKGKWGLPLESDDSDEDTNDITEVLLEEICDIDSVKSSDSDYKSVSSLDLKKDGMDTESKHCGNSSKSIYNNDMKKKNQTHKNEQEIGIVSNKAKEKINKNKITTAKDKKEDAKLLTNLNVKANIVEIEQNTIETKVSNPFALQNEKGDNLEVRKGEASETENGNTITLENTSRKKIGTGSSETKMIDLQEDTFKPKASNIQHGDVIKSESLEGKKHNIKENEAIHKNNKGKTKKAIDKFQPPVKDQNIKCKDNQGIKDKKVSVSINLHNLDSITKDETDPEEKTLFGEKVEGNKQNKTSYNKYKSTEGTSNEAKNSESSKNTKSTKNERKAEKEDIVITLKKNLTGSLELKSIFKEEKKAYANNDHSSISSEIPNVENKRKCKGREEKSNDCFKEKLVCSKDQGKIKTCGKKRKENTCMQQKKSAKKNKKQNTLKTDEIKTEIEEAEEECEILGITSDDEDILSENIVCNEEFPLSVDMDTKLSEDEDSDPFEAE